MPINCPLYNNMLRGLRKVTLQTTLYEEIYVLHGFQEVTSERQVILHD